MIERISQQLKNSILFNGQNDKLLRFIKMSTTNLTTAKDQRPFTCGLNDTCLRFPIRIPY